MTHSYFHSHPQSLCFLYQRLFAVGLFVQFDILLGLLQFCHLLHLSWLIKFVYRLMLSVNNWSQIFVSWVYMSLLQYQPPIEATLILSIPILECFLCLPIRNPTFRVFKTIVLSHSYPLLYHQCNCILLMISPGTGSIDSPFHRLSYFLHNSFPLCVLFPARLAGCFE